MTLLYEQRKGTRENSSTREVLISRYSVVVGVKTRRWNAKQAGDLYDDQLPRES